MKLDRPLRQAPSPLFPPPEKSKQRESGAPQSRSPSRFAYVDSVRPADARSLMNYIAQGCRPSRRKEDWNQRSRWDKDRCQWDQSRMSFYCSSSPPRARLFLPRLQSSTCVVRTTRPSFAPAMDEGGWFDADRNAGAARALWSVRQLRFVAFVLYLFRIRAEL